MGMTQGLEWHTNQKIASISHALIAIVAFATSLDSATPPDVVGRMCNHFRK